MLQRSRVAVIYASECCCIVSNGTRGLMLRRSRVAVFACVAASWHRLPMLFFSFRVRPASESPSALLLLRHRSGC